MITQVSLKAALSRERRVAVEGSRTPGSKGSGCCSYTGDEGRVLRRLEGMDALEGNRSSPSQLIGLVA